MKAPRSFSRTPETDRRRAAAQGLPAPRLLFLDDDPERASTFLAQFPEAVWVQTAADCIARLEEPWDEVHLDHDLGGEHFVELSREDCGMEVVRWLCFEPRPHLRTTWFIIHSHNAHASSMMSAQMMVNGFRVQVQPFGAIEPSPPPLLDFHRPPSPFAALGRWVRRLLRLDEAEADNVGDLETIIRQNERRSDDPPTRPFDPDRLPPPGRGHDPAPVPETRNEPERG
ncbi:MAG: hypothetical protein NVSMB9_24280 [Isosphaeraceae bacterium]